MVGLDTTFPSTCPILDGKNYDKWYVWMKVLLNYQDVMEVVTNGVQDIQVNAIEAQKKEHSENKQKDYKGLFQIHQSVNVSTSKKKKKSATTSKETQQIIENCYKGLDKIKKVRL